MAETFGFFGGATGDTREYGQAEWALFFQFMRASGGIPTWRYADAFKITQSSPAAMSVVVRHSDDGTDNIAEIPSAMLGSGYFASMQNTTVTLPITANSSGNPRIDTVLIQFSGTPVASVAFVVLAGTPAADPDPPTPTGDYILIANIQVANGATSILDANIFDVRADGEVPTGWVTGEALIPDVNWDRDGQKIIDLGAATATTDIMQKQQADDTDSFCFLPTGSITPFGTTTIPVGFLACNGAAVSRTTYAALYAVIGTTFGVGDGSTTFSLPDMDGRIPVGINTADSDFDAIGETGGEATHKLVIGEVPAHTHLGGSTMPVSSVSNSLSQYRLSTTPSATETYESGGNSAHENRPPFITLCYGIRV